MDEPAFPCKRIVEESSPYCSEKISREVNAEGMSLRDYLAAKAMTALLSEEARLEGTSRPDVVAKHAYIYADAMLKARGRAEGRASL